MASSFKIKIAIAEDCKITRDLLDRYLQDMPGITVCIKSPNGKLLLEEIRNTPPDVVIMDVRMEVMDGIESTREIMKINPEIKVIAWSVHCDFHTRIKMFEAGACAFLDKDADAKEIVRGIGSVYEKGFYYNQYLNKEMHESIVSGNKNPVYLVGNAMYSVDEIRMILYIYNEQNIGQMADEFLVNPKTIERWRTTLFEKSNTSSPISLVKFAIKNGLIQP